MEVLLQCESTSALLTIRNMDSKTILSELGLIQEESGKSQIEHLTEQTPPILIPQQDIILLQ